MGNKEMDSTYLVVGNRPWNHRVFDDVVSRYPGQWHFVGSFEQLTLEAVQALNPRFIFFLHWSRKVPDEIVDNYECVCFHMTDVPYGRGGSPLQNLIARGHSTTKLTALRMTRDFDAGPVYLKDDLCLEGSAEEIYLRATYLSSQMIERIIHEQPQPVHQTGEVVVFRRRKPHESEIPQAVTLEALYDFIRMLDADGYPRAFMNYKGFRCEFSRAALREGRIVADVMITPVEVTT